MGRKVFVTSEMSIDERIIEVAERNPQAALLWPWTLTAFDDWGRANADPKRLKASVFPAIETVTPDLIESALELYAEVGLIILYKQNDKTFMAIPPEKWFKYQTHIRGEKRSKDSSRFPAPPSAAQQHSAQVRAGARNDAQSHEDARSCTPSPSPSPTVVPSPSSTPPPPSPTPDGAGEGIGGDGHQADEGRSVGAVEEPGDAYTSDFEEFWRVYPRKVEKRRAFKCWRQRLREGWKPDQLIQAARNYADAKRGTERDYVKHPSTFLSRDRPFTDWIEPSEAALVRAEEERADRPIPVVTDREAYLAELERKRREVERIRAARLAAEGG